MQSIKRLRTIKISVWRSVDMPELKKRAANSWSAVQDTYYSTKDTFERHRVVFTIGTSIASVATALIGYSLRHFHETRMARRLDSIEAAMKNNYQIEREEIKKIVHTGSFSTEASIATVGTTLVIGPIFWRWATFPHRSFSKPYCLHLSRYALGWRGGKWYANRKLKREQMKLLGQIKPRRWRLQFIKRPNFRFIRIPLIRNNSSESAVERSRSTTEGEISS